MEIPALLDYGALSSEALVAACLNSQDNLAWVEFVRRFQKLIAAVVIRTSQLWGELSSQAVDDLVQETFLKLCANDCQLLRSFQSAREHAIFGFVKVLTANLVHDHFKASKAQKRGGSLNISPLEGDPATSPSHSGHLPEIERNILVQQVASYVLAATEGPNAGRDRRVFWLYYRAGLTASAIASLPTVGLSTKGVETLIFRLTRAVRESVAARRTPEERPKESVEGIRPAESL
jgi:RNA polymerase sigma-70 factor, ECF subfamily